MKTLFSGLFILSFLVSSAQETLTFTQAVNTALERNVILNQEKNRQLINQAEKMASWASLGPSVNAGARYRNSRGRQFITQEARLVDIETNDFGYSIDANITVFNGLRLMNGVRQADYNLEAQRQLVKRTEQDIINNVSRQYLQVLLDQELLKIAQDNQSTQEAQLEKIRAEVELGSRAPVDELNQDALVKSAELEVLRSQFRLRNDKATLAQTLQLDPTIDIQLMNPSWDVNSVRLEDYKIDELYTIALENRGDFRNSQEVEKSTKRNVAINRASKYPSLQAFASFGSFYTDASTIGFNDQINQNEATVVGLQIQVPIFNNLNNHLPVVRSRIFYENAVLDRENMENTVKSDVLRSYQNFRDAITNYNAADISLEAARLAFEIEQERFNLGVADFVVLTQASNTYVQAQTDFAQAEYSLLFQKILMDYSLGVLKVEDLEQ